MDDENFSNFFKKLREEGDFELEVQFEGGGDSGWIHDTGETRKKSAGGKDRLTLNFNMNTETTAEELVYQFSY